MHLTRYTDYALRVLMYVAVHPGRLSTITEISQAYSISRNHLVKVVHQMGNLGYLRTHRGKQGGIELGRRPEEINVGQVIRAMEKNLEIVNCDDPACPIRPACRLREALDEARDAFMQVLDRYTLADLAGPEHSLELSELLSAVR